MKSFRFIGLILLSACSINTAQSSSIPGAKTCAEFRTDCEYICKGYGGVSFENRPKEKDEYSSLGNYKVWTEAYQSFSYEFSF